MKLNALKIHLSLSLALAVPLPLAAQEAVIARLETSPRHHEWVTVDSGGRAVHAYVAYPEVAQKATTVLVIHENRGLNDWARSVADQLAEAGYLAIAPDLLSGLGPGGGKTSDFPTTDAAREAIYTLEPDRVMADLAAVADHALKLPASNGKLAVAGFCWGGGQAFRFATRRPELAAAFVFYGAFEHTREELARIAAPVYGFYGENDERINATIPETAVSMKELGKTYEPVLYAGAGHGFLRRGEETSGPAADQKARAEAWERWKKILAGL
jgi:carboxymethylenebutenolidase